MENRIQYKTVEEPKLDCSNVPAQLSDETMRQRYEHVLAKMKEKNYDSLVIYADLEHGNNFEYLTGFLPRFEEALLVLHQNGNNFMIMGNENLNKVSGARIQAEALHAPHFSLPNQPMDTNESLSHILRKAQIKDGQNIGLVGWKNFTSKSEDNKKLFDTPFYIVDSIKAIVKDKGNVTNATDLFIGEHGVRCINNVNEIEHYEFGASLASDCILKAMNAIEVGLSEMELGTILNEKGQKNSVVTIAAAGKRFINANIYPTENQVKIGDPISLTVGYKGGLSSRVGYAVNDETELPENCEDYIDKVVKPYYGAVVHWLENVTWGVTGGEIYDLIQKVLPKEIYNWSLCPGHLTADEEWMSSPIYNQSSEIIKSGMLFQVDIIPSLKGYAGTSAECTVLIADDQLKAEISKLAPELWKRIQTRRAYIENNLNIRISESVLPMSSTVGYLRPFLLNKEKAMAVD